MAKLNHFQAIQSHFVVLKYILGGFENLKWFKTYRHTIPSASTDSNMLLRSISS